MESPFLLVSHGYGHRLSAENHDRAGLRCCDRVAARSCVHTLAAPPQPGAVEARRPAARVLVQAARCVQQNGAVGAGGARERRDCGVGRQPRAGCRAGSAAAGLQGNHRDAGDHAPHQDCGGRGTGRHRHPPRRLVFGCLCPCGGAAAEVGRGVCASLRRPRRHRRRRDDRRRDPAAMPGAARRDLRGRRRGWPDQRHRRLRQTGPP